MAYTAWSVVFGEQPTAAKWNQLGTNDAGFKDGTNIDNDAIIARHIDDGAVQLKTDITTYGKCRLFNSANQVIGTGGWTSFTFDSEDSDGDAMHSTGSRITIPTGGDGWYYIAGQIRWSASVTGARGLKFKKNGAASSKTGGLFEATPSGGAGATNLYCSTMAYLVAGDYIEMQGYQTSGGNLNAEPNSGEYELGTYFMMARMP